MPATTVEDTISGQFTHVMLFTPATPGGVELSGIQSFDYTFNNPKELTTDTSGKIRSRRTGVYRVDWTIRRWVIRRNTLPVLLGLSTTGASQNYSWQQALFDMAVNFIEQTPAGLTAGAGGWNAYQCEALTWHVSLPDPFGFVMEELTGYGQVQTEQAWS